MENVLQIAGLTKFYNRHAAPAVNNLFLDLPKGKIVGLLGPNGEHMKVRHIIKKI